MHLVGESRGKNFNKIEEKFHPHFFCVSSTNRFGNNRVSNHALAKERAGMKTMLAPEKEGADCSFRKINARDANFTKNTTAGKNFAYKMGA